MKQILLLVIFASTIAGCKKKHNNPEPNFPVDDVRTVLLKDVITQSLPEPYFHFTYDSQRYVQQIDFASGFHLYNIAYENKRVKKITNTRNGFTLVYSYNNQLVTEINEFSAPTPDKRFSYQFSYNKDNQLVQLLWLEFSNSSSGNLFRKATFTYYPDGNLAGLTRYSNTAAGMSLIARETFYNYDDKTNVDDFYLLKGGFLENLLFLPQVKLQKNNPRNRQIISVENDYEITYVYQYQNALPTVKTATILQTRGTDAGRSIQTIDQFTYY